MQDRVFGRVLFVCCGNLPSSKSMPKKCVCKTNPILCFSAMHANRTFIRIISTSLWTFNRPKKQFQSKRSPYIVPCGVQSSRSGARKHSSVSSCKRNRPEGNSLQFAFSIYFIHVSVCAQCCTQKQQRNKMKWKKWKTTTISLHFLRLSWKFDSSNVHTECVWIESTDRKRKERTRVRHRVILCVKINSRQTKWIESFVQKIVDLLLFARVELTSLKRNHFISSSNSQCIWQTNWAHSPFHYCFSFSLNLLSPHTFSTVDRRELKRRE